MGTFGFLPVYNEDYFLQFRPWPENSTNLFILHWHEICFSFFFYLGLQILSPKVSTILFKDTYTSLKPALKINFDIHMVSMVQAIVSVASLIPMWNHPNWANRAVDPETSMFSYYPYGGFVSSITLGYFIWDLYVCARYYKLFGIGFLFHAIAAMTVFACSLVPVALPWVPGFLIFELSTPFVNINWFASKLPVGSIPEAVIVINGLILISVFFYVRIVWGFYSAYQVLINFIAVWDQLHWFFPLTIMSLNLVIDILNVYWFYRMISIAKKKICGSKSSTKKKSKVD